MNRHRFRSIRRGQSLVEFALVSLVVYMLLAAILTFGHMLYVAQGAQMAADLLAREISRTPLPAELTLNEALDSDDVTQQIYDEHYLVLNLDSLHGRSTLQELIGDLPLVNQQLTTLMIYDEINGVRVLRYPGAVYTDADSSDDPTDPVPSGMLVEIPLVSSRGGDGTETISWTPVVEPIDENSDPFPLSSSRRGVVALRINYPFQSASMSGFRSNPAGPYEPTVGNPIVADDGAVVQEDNVGGALLSSDFEFGPYSGDFGLGKHAAFGSAQLLGPVRPYRKVISAQAIYRRELFTND